MKTLGRVAMFGLISGILWSVAPGFLADLFSVRADAPATIIASIVSGLITSSILAALVVRVRRGVAVVLGLLSLPLGAFVFGFSLAVISRFSPALTSGERVLTEPWTLGFNYAIWSVISVFALGLFPLAVITTLLLRVCILRGYKLHNEA